VGKIAKSIARFLTSHIYMINFHIRNELKKGSD